MRRPSGHAPPVFRANAIVKKGSLLYYCRPGEGGEPLQRTLAIARHLSESFKVILLLTELPPPDAFAVADVQIVHLPRIDTDEIRQTDRDAHGATLEKQMATRRDLILATYREVKPSVVIVENFPFSQRYLAGEILPLIEHATDGGHGDTLVVCSTDGILATDRPNHEDRDDESASLLNKYFDLVVVHTDSVFARLEEFFQPANTLTTPLFHTGFVSPDSGVMATTKDTDEDMVLVSAGDGFRGGGLFRAAVQAQKTIWHPLRLPMTIVAGERLPETEWRQLRSLAKDVPRLTLKRNVRNMREAIRLARWSVNQCAYSVATDIIETGTPALFVPCHDGHRLEQITRAQRLVYWGAGRLLMPQHLNGASLANEILQLTKFESREIIFDFDGAAKTAELISESVFGDKFASSSAEDSVLLPSR